MPRVSRWVERNENVNWKQGLYSIAGEKDQMDDDGNRKDQYKRYCLGRVMKEFSYFKKEKSVMETLVYLPSEGDCKCILLVSPKYHCKLAGLWIDYSWGLSKKWYRHLLMAEKRSSQAFRASVQNSLQRLTIEQVQLFAAKARRYMLTYNMYDDDQSKQQTYKGIEKYVKTEMKSHRCTGDQEWGYIALVWRQAMKAEHQLP
jgi:hypothetical protein